MAAVTVTDAPLAVLNTANEQIKKTCTVVSLESPEAVEDLTNILKHDVDSDGIFDIPKHPRMEYEDIFGEPEMYKTRGLGKYINECMTRVFGGTYHYVQSTFYYILVMLTGFCLAFLYGLFFGLLIYFINWFVHPMIKLFFMFSRLTSACYRPMVRIWLDPFFQSAGQIFGSIRAVVGIKLPTAQPAPPPKPPTLVQVNAIRGVEVVEVDSEPEIVSPSVPPRKV